MKHVFPPIETVVAFLDSLKLDAQFYYDKGKLVAECRDKDNNIYEVLFKHFDIKCDKILNIKPMWINFIAENDKQYFKEYCEYYRRKNESAINGANKFLEHLERDGYIVRDADSADDKTVD